MKEILQLCSLSRLYNEQIIFQVYLTEYKRIRYIQQHQRFGEIVDVHLVRDKKTGKSLGYAFLAYENQRSTILAIDNFNGAVVCGRKLRVDHVKKFRVPKAFTQINEKEVIQEIDEEQLYKPSGPDGKGWGQFRDKSSFDESFQQQELQIKQQQQERNKKILKHLRETKEKQIILDEDERWEKMLMNHVEEEPLKQKIEELQEKTIILEQKLKQTEQKDVVKNQQNIFRQEKDHHHHYHHHQKQKQTIGSDDQINEQQKVNLDQEQRFMLKQGKSKSRSHSKNCLLYTSDAADDMQCVDLGGRRIIQKKNELIQ
eukprot:TRINITY_DN2008_c0_g1_i1.p1 TRINITY_DN2008_c0_g1~~TRINITY_DN2008_c0_g1_i1.p1  ORF type:complete len:314 (-),score=69.06 TRINITY_DN2008_c0_g1_i1:66-1007(-)